MDKTSIADRMKNNYEKRYKNYLTRRTPVIMRLDGKCFSNFTKHMERPFDKNFNNMMRQTALKLCDEIQGAKCAYVQSDEISILITDYDKLTTDAWFDYQVQKMVSISASIASAEFNKSFLSNYIEFLAGDYETEGADYVLQQIFAFRKNTKLAYFDSRVFNIPMEDVNNYFVWRQQDWLRNSIQLASQSQFSHKELHKKNTMQMKQMLIEQKDILWDDYEDKWKNGSFCININGGWVYFDLCPRFNENSAAIDYLLKR